MANEATLLSTETNVTGAWQSFDDKQHPEMKVVFVVASAGTLQVQGKLESNATAVNLHTAATATGTQVITTFPYMRAVSSGVSGGAVAVVVRGA